LAGLSGAAALVAATISFVSLAVGIPVGVIAGHLAFAGIANHPGADAGQVAAWSVLAVVVVAVVVITPLIASWPAWRAARQRPAIVLRGE
jgi:ABC-type antimicrobial peptide transport system permease subunit